MSHQKRTRPAWRRPQLWAALAAITVLAGTAAATGLLSSGHASAATTRTQAGKQRYVMVTFLSGIQFWKPAFRGMQAAATQLRVSAQYQGTPNYSAQDEVTVLQQVAATHPTGIIVTAQNPDALKQPIHALIQKGVPVVMFDSDSPDSGRQALVAVNNASGGAVAADIMAKSIGGKGEVAVITTPGQFNLDQREAGFKAEIAKKHSGMKVVAVANALTDYTTSAAAASQFLQAHPNLKGIFSTGSAGAPGSAQALKEVHKLGKVTLVGFDIDTATIQGIKNGQIKATIVQGAYCEGYWAMQYLFGLRNNRLHPVANPKAAGIPVLPAYTDCGVFPVTKTNVNAYASG
jgi:ribose transport system substrate-binding protein